MERRKMIIAGAVVGLLAILLVLWGNPKNMGVCVVCFIRDISGALGLHRAAVVQTIRQEIPGFILGAFLAALAFKEFRPRGGSSPVLRFFLGGMVSIGALLFLGCPLRMVLRLAGGDLNALVGLAGFIVGILVGVYFLRQGFTLGRSYPQSKAAGLVAPLFAIGLVILAFVGPSFIFQSESGPASQFAPRLLALGAGLLVGFLGQRTRLCMVGGVRDVVLFKDTHLISGFLAIFVIALIGNLIVGDFHLGFVDQPVAHNNHLYNFLGLAVVGLGATLLGGCPLRQLIMAGEGDVDAMTTVMGLLTGAAIAHNFGLAASGAGVPENGQIAGWIILVIMLLVGWTATETLRVVRPAQASKDKGVSA